MEEHAAADSRTREIIAYAYLHVFAIDGTIHADELALLKKLALKDGVVDDSEARALHRIFDHLERRPVSPEALQCILAFRKLYPRANYLP